MSQLDDITTKVTKLEGKVNSIETMSGKLDTTIEKLTDVSTSIKTMLAVHEEKINRGGEVDDELFSQIEMRRRELSKDIKEVHSRLNTTSKELRQCIKLSPLIAGCKYGTDLIGPSGSKNPKNFACGSV